MNADDQPSAAPAFSPARVLRRIALWVTLAVIVGLIVLSIVGAQLGPMRARRLFNSWPMAAVWIALAAGLLAAPFAFAGLRSIAAMAMHAGLALVLIGSLWGSQAMHEFRAAHLGETRVWRGIVGLRAGLPQQTVDLDPDIFADPPPAKPRKATLPFALQLDRFWIDLYEPSPAKWWLFTPVQCTDGRLHNMILDWETGEPLRLDNQRAVMVEHYIPHARVAVRPASTSQGEPATTTQLELTVEPDEKSPFPAARLALADANGPREFWLIPPTEPDGVVCPPEPDEENQPIGLVRYDPENPDEVRSYNAQVQVWRDGKSLGGKLIRVNHPLHYGGYDFYQMGWDKYRNDTTYLRVVADGGLGWVYAGFLVGLLGLFWKLWGEKAARRLVRSKVRP